MKTTLTLSASLSLFMLRDINCVIYSVLKSTIKFIQKRFYFMFCLILVYINLFKFDCETNYFTYVNHTRVRSWCQLILSNEGILFLTDFKIGSFDAFRTED